MRRLTVGAAGQPVSLHMVRGAEAPLMLRGLHYTVKLHRMLPTRAAATPAERAAVAALVVGGGGARAAPAASGAGACKAARIRVSFPSPLSESLIRVPFPVVVIRVLFRVPG